MRFILLSIVVRCRLANSGFGHSGTRPSSLPSSPLPSSPSSHLPSSPSFPLPSLLPFAGAPPPKPARGLGDRCKLPQWGLEQSPSRQTIWCISESEPKVAALVATVIVHFHKNKFKFMLQSL